MANFKMALLYCLQNEGGFVNKKDDHGGPTNKGITLSLLAKYRGKISSIADLQDITDTEVYMLYQRLFWEPLGIQDLPQAIATALLDTAINHGEGAAIRMAQDALGREVSSDGVMGTETFHALLIADPNEFIYNFVGVIQDKFARICSHAQDQTTFLEGWLRRARRLFLLVL